MLRTKKPHFSLIIISLRTSIIMFSLQKKNKNKHILFNNLSFQNVFKKTGQIEAWCSYKLCSYKKSVYIKYVLHTMSTNIKSNWTFICRTENLLQVWGTFLIIHTMHYIDCTLITLHTKNNLVNEKLMVHCDISFTY